MTKRLQQQIRKYAKSFADALYTGKVNPPGNSDCWGCLFVDVKTGKPAMGNNHFKDHMRERYFVPSLLTNAIRTQEHAPAVEYVLQAIWNKDDDKKEISKSTMEHFGSLMKRQIQSLIYHHVKDSF